MNAANPLPKELQPGATIERFFTIEQRQIDEEARTVELAFSSEFRGERWWGVEILDHSPGAMRTDRLVAGGALLVNHDTRDQVGVVESVRTDADRVGRALVRFGRSARAEEIFQDVKDGIRKNVSVRYRIHEAVLESSKDGVDTYRVLDWEPIEISIVPVPFDPTVGVGRNHQDTPEKTPMSKTTNTAPAVEDVTPPANNARAVDTEQERRAGADTERKRVSEIMAAGKLYARFGANDLAAEAVSNGMSMDEFRGKLIELMDKAPKPSANIGMSDDDKREYSIVRALNYLANPTDKRARDAAEFERECSRAAADKLNKESRGLIVPFDVLSQTRELTVANAASAGDLVATNLLSGSFIDLLRNAMVLNTMGVTYLTGLVGNIAIPRQTGGGTAHWVDEGGTGTDSDQTVNQVPMSPKCVLARTQISRKLLKQSSIDVEGFVRGDLAKVLGLAIQAAAIVGGGANEPDGILSTVGIGDVPGGTDGGAPDWDHIVDLETAVAVANADIGTLAYLTNAKVRGKLKKTFVDGPGTGERVWQNGSTPLNGYRAAVTNAAPSNLTKGSGIDLSAIIFGNFADLIIGMWGGLDLQVDPYSAGDSGAVIVRAFQDVDVAVRHAESFAAMKDAITE